MMQKLCGVIHAQLGETYNSSAYTWRRRLPDVTRKTTAGPAHALLIYCEAASYWCSALSLLRKFESVDSMEGSLFSCSLRPPRLDIRTLWATLTEYSSAYQMRLVWLGISIHPVALEIKPRRFW